MPAALLQIAKKLAYDAGQEALKIQKRNFTINTKGSHFNLVTEADKASEKLITETIQRNFPDHTIISEESEEIKGSSDYKWIIDPIDGTTNFAHGLPIFGISIAVIYKGKPIIGVVEIPALRETFWAREGQGAYLGDKKIQVSTTSDLKNALTATGFPYKRDSARYSTNMKLWDAFYKNSHGVRRMGAASVDLCYVACGRFDAYWEYDLKTWDLAAGKIIVEEAGGTVTNMDGSKLNPKLGNLLSSNTRLHSDMLAKLKQFGADKV